MTSSPYIRGITFENGNRARAVEVPPDLEADVILESLGLTQMPKGIIPISGGALEYPPTVVERTEAVMNAIVGLAFDCQIMLVDGGTKTGVMQITGKCFAKSKESSADGYYPPLVGFSPEFMVTYPGVDQPRHPKSAELDPNHPYFVLVKEIRDWGEEVECMFKFADFISELRPSVAILANGGLITISEVLHDVRQDRELIVLEGSLRSAEAIVAALDGKSENELTDILLNRTKLIKPGEEWRLGQVLTQLQEIKECGRVTRFRLDEPPQKLAKLLGDKLGL